MADITAQEVNAFATNDPDIGAPIFVLNGANLNIDISVLTGDNLGTDLSAINLAEAITKLLDITSRTALDKYNNNNLQDARPSYPLLRTSLATNSNGEQVLRFTGTAVSETGINLNTAQAL